MSASQWDFLHDYGPLEGAGRLDLAAFDPLVPGRAPDCATFLPHQKDQMHAWLEARKKTHNLYFSQNEARADAQPHKRLSKKTIGFIRSICVDLDPEKVEGGDPTGAHFRQERERLAKLVESICTGTCPPTCVVDTGGGYQLHWEFGMKVPNTPENQILAEGIGRTLAQRFGGDNTQDISRLLRVPGTINFPDAGKKAQGREPAPTALIENYCSDLWPSIEELAAWAPPTPATTKSGADNNAEIAAAMKEIDFAAVGEIMEYEDIPEPTRKKFESYKSRYPTARRLYDDGIPPPWCDGTGSDFEFALARFLKQTADFTVTDFGMLLAPWEHRSQKTFTDRSIARSWVNCGPAGNSGFDDHSGVNSGLDDHSAGAQWDEPDDFWRHSTAEPPPLPAGVVPDIVEQFANKASRRLGVDPGAVAAVAVTAFGACIPAGNQLQLRQFDTKWTARPITWTALVAPPGANKSATLAAATDVVRAAEKKQQAKSAYVAKQGSSQPQQAGNRTGEGSSESVSQAPTRKAQLPRKTIHDATTEAVAQVAAENPHGLLLMPDELMTFVGGLDAYRRSSGKDRAFWLEAKAGKNYSVTRKGAGHIDIDRLAVSIVATIQDKKLGKLASTLDDDGLLQRFHLIRVRRFGHGEDVPPDRKLDRAIDSLVFDLLMAAPSGLYKLSPDADKELQNILRFVDRERGGAANISGAFEQWGDKLPNEFGAFCLIFHFIEWYSSELYGMVEGAPPELVSAETAHRAYRYLTEYSYPHARQCYEVIFGTDETNRHAEWIAEHILVHRRETITVRQIQQAYTALKKPEKKGALHNAMQLLDTCGWVQVDKWSRDTRPTAWRVSPKVHDGRFASVMQTERTRREAVKEEIKAAAPARSAQKRCDGLKRGHPCGIGKSTLFQKPPAVSHAPRGEK